MSDVLLEPVDQEAPAPARRPRKVTTTTLDARLELIGAGLASLCLVAVVYAHVLPTSGILGFIVCWFVTFLVLHGLIAHHKAEARMKVVGDYLSYDPYGIMFRKDEPQMAAAVEAAFRKLATNRDLLPLYQKWFVARLPTGEKLNVPISPQLEESFKVLDSGSNN